MEEEGEVQDVVGGGSALACMAASICSKAFSFLRESVPNFLVKSSTKNSQKLWVWKRLKVSRKPICFPKLPSKLARKIQKWCMVLTHDFQWNWVTFPSSFRIDGPAGVVSHGIHWDVLQNQTLSAHNDTLGGILLQFLVLKTERNFYNCDV